MSNSPPDSLIRPRSFERRTAAISQDNLREYAKTGWTMVRGFFDPEETARLDQFTREITERPEKPGEHMVYSEDSAGGPDTRVLQRIENFCPFHVGFDELIRRGVLDQAAEAFLGGPACLFKEKINFKLPGGSGFEAHQDQQAGWSVFAPIFLTILVSIDEATIENGCLEMPFADRVKEMVGEEWKPLTTDQLRPYPLLPAPTKPGDVIFFDSYTPHASKANMSDQPRRLLYLTYNLKCYGDHRARYFEEKRANYPPDIEREEGKTYTFKV